MNYSAIRKGYHNFERWSVTIELENHKIYPDETIDLKRMQIELNSELSCNCARILLAPSDVESGLFEKAQTGALLHISLGYQGQEQSVFLGYLHEVRFSSQHQNFLREVELYALDVKGLMMLKKRSEVQAKKKRSAWIQEILKDSCYQKYIKNMVIDTLPTALDGWLFLDGRTDYDIISQICKDSFYSCFVAGDTLYFQERGKKGKNQLTFDTYQDIERMEQITRMENQIGKLMISNCDGFQKKQKVEETYKISGMPQSSCMSSILAHTSAVWIDDGLHSVEEMNAVKSGLLKEIKQSYGRLGGNCSMLPELMCTTNIKIKTFCDGKSKEGILYHVEHSIDEEGARSEWEAILTKG